MIFKNYSLLTITLKPINLIRVEPMYIIFNAKVSPIAKYQVHSTDGWNHTSISNNYLIGTLETGYSNNELTMKWLIHYKRFSARWQVGSSWLPLLDGFGSHYTKQFIDFCDVHQIVPCCLPPYACHLLQSLGVVVFQPYKHYHTKAVKAVTLLNSEEGVVTLIM